MGKHARIAELEAQIEHLKDQLQVTEYYRELLEKIAELPEDTVCLYTTSGMRVQFEVGMAVRAALQLGHPLNG